MQHLSVRENPVLHHFSPDLPPWACVYLYPSCCVIFVEFDVFFCCDSLLRLTCSFCCYSLLRLMCSFVAIVYWGWRVIFVAIVTQEGNKYAGKTCCNQCNNLYVEGGCTQKSSICFFIQQYLGLFCFHPSIVFITHIYV